ncbi:MAG TPA: hypothetical protein VGK89_05735 [Candidatus Eisenbacteria bacterium]|jgi:hypothetical protein
MAARLRLRAAPGLLALAVWLGGPGCGPAFKLPTEHRENRDLVGNGTYEMVYTWDHMGGVRDLLLVPGPQLFVAFQGNPGRVFEFSTTGPYPLAVDRFAGLLNPAALASGGNRLFVLDQGDTAAARATRDYAGDSLDCGPLSGFRRPIVDLSKYWYVREYDLKGRTLYSSFSDTTFAWVNGIAADAGGRVYVSGVVYGCSVDRFDPRLKTLVFEFRIRRYLRGGGGFVVGGWHKDRDFEITEGTGIGSAGDPRGMHWSDITGSALFFADVKNSDVQKLDELGSLSNSYKLVACDRDTTDLVTPLDVNVDQAGFVYVVDSGNRRVMRYDPAGDCVQRVDIEPDRHQQRLVAPVAVAADVIDDRDFVYVADAGAGEIVVYRRRK